MADRLVSIDTAQAPTAQFPPLVLAEVEAIAATVTPVVTVTADDITDATAVGKSLLTAADVPAGRAVLGINTEYNVKDYGAIGDAATNDTSAVQDAVDALQDAGGGVLYVPAGTYSVSALTVDPAKASIVIQGAGRTVSVIEKRAHGTLLDVSGSATGSATHMHGVHILDLQLNGNAMTGALIRAYYADTMTCENVYLLNNDGSCVETAELWDSRFDNCVFDSLSTTQAAVWLRSSAAATGNYGHSVDNTNNIRFNHCRWESWKFGALRMEGGPDFVSLLYAVNVTNCKIESAGIRGMAVVVNGDCEIIHIDNLFLWGGGFDGGFSTPQTAIYFTPSSHGSLRDVYIGCSATQVWNIGVQPWTVNGNLVLDNIQYRGGAAPVGAVVYFDSGSGPIEVGAVTSTSDVLFGGSPNVLGPRPLKTVTAASASELTPDLSTTGQYNYTALAADLTINAPLAWGKCLVDGQELVLRIKDDATPRNLTWNGAYRAIGVSLPANTTASKTLYVRGRYNIADTKVDILDVQVEA